VVLDELGEVTASLAHRAELHEAKLAIEQAQIGIGVAKNQALPKLDVIFRYIVDGLGTNNDRAFSQMTENDFNEYLLTVQFEWPIGNRGPEAAIRRARYAQAQAIAGHKATIEQVIAEVKVAIRDLHSLHEQILPTLESAEASSNQLRATVDRAVRWSVEALQVELNAHEALASAREQLITLVINYNVAIVNLERQKGTLLRYNNIVLEGVDNYSERFRAAMHSN
jgi:outer membrane protein TolC